MLAGYDSNNLQLNDLNVDDSGIYTLKVSNKAGTAETSVKIDVYSELTFAKEPSSIEVYVGGDGKLTAEVEGTAPVTYQWKFKGENIVGETSNELNLSNISDDNVGSYQIVASNPVSTIVSGDALLKLLQPVTIEQQPSGGTYRLGSGVNLSVNAVGTQPISYQWSKNGVDIDGAIDKSFNIANSTSDVDGDYRVKVTNGGGSVTSEVATVKILMPPTIGALDDVKEVSIGDTVTITAPVSGDGTFNYQWLKNGINIPGETSNQLTLDNVKLADSGGYSLNVGAVFEGASTALYSNTMLLRAEAASTALGDSSASAAQIEGSSGNVRGDSSAVGKDAWLTWIAPANGIASFNTIGSSYDTTLVVFDGTKEVARDEDSGDYGTSAIQFNAALDRVYSIHIQGVNGAVGDAVISWSLEETEIVLPVIAAQPIDVNVESGAKGEISVTLESEPADIQYQWYRDGVELSGETTSSIVFEAVDQGSIGNYTVIIKSGVPGTESYREIISDSAKLIIGDSSADSKLDFGSIGAQNNNDTGNKGNEPVLGGPNLLARLKERVRNIQKMPGEFSNSSVSVYSTVGAAKEAGEPNHAGKTGGASAWTTFTPSESGTAKISTENSDFDTVLAIYSISSGSGWDSLEEVASDDNSGTDGQDSEVVFEVSKDTVYLVAVDGAAGESGTVQLNQELAQKPEITSISNDISVILGGTATLQVEASNPLANASLSYQWYQDGVEITGANESSLKVANAGFNSVGNYTVDVSNYAGSVESAAVSLNVVQSVTIETQPESGEISEGESRSLSVVAVGSSPISYQWKLNGAAIIGANSSSLVINNAQGSDAGSYTVDIANPAGTKTSNEAIIVVNAPPSIVNIVKDVSVQEGANFNLWVNASGANPISYQWKKDGVAIPAGISNFYRIFNATTASAGVYTVVISNSAGITVSDSIKVTIDVPPGIVTQPKSITLGSGGSAQLSVAASGTDISYSWSKNGAILDGQTNSTLKINNATNSDAGTYSVLVSNGIGSVQSSDAVITVFSAPEITEQPVGTVVAFGGSAELNVKAESVGAVEYQWKLNGVNLNGENSSSLTITSLKYSQAGEYTVEVSNSAGFVNSSAASIEVLTPVTIASQPNSIDIIEGEDGELQVVAQGSAPISYQWYKGGDVIEGASENSIKLTAVSLGDSGSYSVVATNPISTVDSSDSTVSVKLKPAIELQPTGVTVVQGESATLNVRASGDGALAYQWYFNGLAINGADSSQLTIQSSEKTDQGSYNAVISSEYGVVSSTQANINVLMPVEITSNPIGGTVSEYGSISLEVVVSGTGPINYAWYKGRSKIEGANESKLIFENIRTKDAGDYSVVVSNSINSLTSEAVSIDVVRPVVIVRDVTQSKSENILLVDDSGVESEYQYYNEGSYVRLYAVATGTGPLTYQWQKDNIDIKGQNRSTLIFTSINDEDEGTYRLVVSNKVGLKLSREVELNVNKAPTLGAITDANTNAGENVSISIMAADSDGDKSKLRYSLAGNPNGMTINAKTGEVKWPVSDSQNGGVYSSEVTVTDELGATSSQRFNVIVNALPIVENIVPIDAEIGDRIYVTVKASDPEGGKLSYRAINTPNGFSGNVRNGINGNFVWASKNAQKGIYTIDIEVSDPEGAKSIVQAIVNLSSEIKLSLHASETVNGEYQKTIINVDWDFDKNTVSVPSDEAQRFFKVQIEGKKNVKINNIRRSNGRVVIGYSF